MAYVRKKKALTDFEEARKRDAMTLAKLLLDMYKESKIKKSPNNIKE